MCDQNLIYGKKEDCVFVQKSYSSTSTNILKTGNVDNIGRTAKLFQRFFHQNSANL